MNLIKRKLGAIKTGVFIVILSIFLSGCASGNVTVDLESDPLYDEANFLVGSVVERWIQVTNHTDEAQFVDIWIQNNGGDKSEDLLKELNFQFKNGETELYNGKLSDLLNDKIREELTETGTVEYKAIMSLDDNIPDNLLGTTAEFTFYVGYNGNNYKVTDVNTVSMATDLQYLPGSFTLSNETPICDTNDPEGPAIRLNWKPADGATSYHVYRGGSLYENVATDCTFYNSANVIAGQTYEYYIQARNASGYANSNTITVPVESDICDSSPQSSCYDGIKNQDETDIDCGGFCPACVDGKSCNINDDCQSSLCKDGFCARVTTDIALSDSVLDSEIMNWPGHVFGEYIRITNTGTEALRYGVRAVQTGGDESLCNMFNVRVRNENEEVYSGNLMAFDLSDEQIFLGNNYENSHSWSFTIESVFSMDNLQYALRNRSCEFDFVFYGSQDKNYPAGFSDTEVDHNVIKSGNWGNADTVYINNGIDGGECLLIGSWDNEAKKCTLTQNIHKTINIESNGVTLDGNGHTITKGNEYPDGESMGVFILRKSDITIKNLIIENFADGIYLADATDILLKDNYIKNNDTDNHIIGIYLSNCEKIAIEKNTIEDSSSGIQLWRSSNNNIKDNIINSEWVSLSLFGDEESGSDNNIITDNLFSSNYDDIISICLRASNNSVYHNNFLVGQEDEEGEDEALSQDESNIFSLPLPIGGNYWSNYDEVSEGCLDNNNDNICDSAHYLGGSQDNFPWTKQNGWTDNNNPQPNPQCSDNEDNDGDGLIDYPNDPGCENAEDEDETNELFISTAYQVGDYLVLNEECYGIWHDKCIFRITPSLDANEPETNILGGSGLSLFVKNSPIKVIEDSRQWNI